MGPGPQAPPPNNRGKKKNMKTRVRAPAFLHKDRKLFVACFAVIFIDDYSLIGNDLIIVPLMCLMCVAIPFVLVTIAPRFITAAEVNLFFLLETIIGPIWVWLIIKEQPTTETILGGIVIIVTIAVHSFLKLKKS